MAKTKLHATRKALGSGWSQDRVVRQLRQRARTLNLPVASAASLSIMLSRWENGHVQVTEPAYRRLFREIYGRTDEELGFPEEPLDETAEELRSRLLRADAVDSATVELFRRQIDDTRHLDRRFGGLPLLDQVTARTAQIDQLLRHGARLPLRQALAEVLADAATLAGWEALDRGSLSLAWQHHETAKAAAREADSAPFLAYATGQQAFILIELGLLTEAVELLEHADGLGKNDTARLLRAWSAAALGEGLAARGDTDAALRSFDHATALLPDDPNDPDLPFLMLNAGHLARWRGHALSRIRDPRAITELQGVLDGVSPATARARAGTLVDLAFACAAAGDRDGALCYAREARKIAAQIGSERQKRRLAGLLLPDVPREKIQQHRDYRPRAE
jgi:tetratricopeptide (TPR) repeat protein